MISKENNYSIRACLNFAFEYSCEKILYGTRHFFAVVCGQSDEKNNVVQDDIYRKYAKV